MKRLVGLLIAGVLLTGCAQIIAVPLNLDGSKKGGEDGIRYYIPKPYLLVMELPIPPNPPPAPKSRSAQPSPLPQTGPPAQTSPPVAQASDTSFSVTNSVYTAKIVYLPDYSQPMVLQMSPGIFGNTSMALTLQDGWMLTSFNSSADSGGAAVVSAITQMAGSILGGTVKTITPAIRGESASPIPASWGEAVLPPGLYEFEYAARGGTGVVSEGMFIGLKPIMYFCKDGMRPATAAAGHSKTPCEEGKSK